MRIEKVTNLAQSPLRYLGVVIRVDVKVSFPTTTALGTVDTAARARAIRATRQGRDFQSKCKGELRERPKERERRWDDHGC